MSGRSKRIAKVAAEVEEGLAAARKLEQVAGLPDDKLFFEDKGAQSRRRPGKAKPVATSPSSALTAGAGLAAPVLPAQYIVAKPVKSSKVTAVVPVPAPAPVAPPAGEQLYDAWEEDEGAPAKKKFIPQLSKVAKVPAVVLPHPGTSYNPSVDDHQDALGIVVAKTLKKRFRAEMAREARALPQDYDPGTVPSHDVEEGEEGSAPATKPWVSSRRRQNERVTTAQRNRRARHAEVLRAIAEQKRERRQMQDIDRVRVIEKRLIDKEAAQAAQREAHAIIRAQEEKEKLEALSLPSHASEVALTEELTGSLRTISTKASVIKERFTSLIRRGLAGKVRGQKPKKKKVRVLRDK